MRVSLHPVRKPPPSLPASPARPFLDPRGAAVIIGSRAVSGLDGSVLPTPSTLFGPRGAAAGSGRGPLFVNDTGHHRLLVWNDWPSVDAAPADLVIGQPDFFREGRNAKTDIGPSTLNVPTGVAAEGGVLAVADAWNHRVLIWHGYPKRSNQPADVVVGQADFQSGLTNRGQETATAASLNWCYGVALIGGALYVCDTGNRRVLRWNSVPQSNGAAADLVLGQLDFVTRDENAGHAADAMSMRWPHAVVAAHGRLLVADAGNNRVMVWDTVPGGNGTPCDRVLGQASASAVDHNAASYYPTAQTLNMPYGLALLGDRVAVADTANSRIVAFDADGLTANAAASGLAGQERFEDKGDNRWRPASRNSLCWPYGLSSSGTTLVVADSGNNRVMVWEAAS